MKRILTFVIAAGTLFSCTTEGKKTEEIPVEEPVAYRAAVIVEDMDTTINPADNFYMYANGNWIKNNPIPDTEKRWGSFNELDKMHQDRLKKLVDEVATKEQKAGSPEQLVGAYYKAFMDSTARNAKGYEPIKPYLEEIAQIKDKNELPALIAREHLMGVGSFFSLSVGQHKVKSDEYALYVWQSGLGLPNKDYYKEENWSDIRDAYKKHLSKMFAMTGKDSAEAEKLAETVYQIEDDLSTGSRRPKDLRNPDKQYNPYSKKELVQGSKNFDWEKYFSVLDLKGFDSLIVGQPEFIDNFNKVLAKYPLDDIKTYLEWKVIDNFAGHLSDDFVQANFDFYSTTLNGVKTQKPRWKRATQEMTGVAINEALGKLFVEKHFSPEAKEKLNEMVDNLTAAYKERLQNLSWMSPETKEKALLKLSTFDRKLGYPEEWKDYSALTLKADDYLGNYVANSKFSIRENYDKLGKEVDRTEWGMPPHMVNAYYSPSKNEIVFPAGIIQPPFFDVNAEDAVNYGRMGMIIGHEITHGFDDNGSKYDEKGSLNNWWTEEDRKKFDEMAGKLGATYDAFCPFDSVCVQSELTMGENIADFGGTTVAYYAYLKTDEAKAGKKVDGFTPEQRFFIAMAQIWKNNIRDEALKLQIATDPHSPAIYRVNGPLMHMPEFYAAFNIPDQSGMRLADDTRSTIW